MILARHGNSSFPSKIVKAGLPYIRSRPRLRPYLSDRCIAKAPSKFKSCPRLAVQVQIVFGAGYFGCIGARESSGYNSRMRLKEQNRIAAIQRSQQLYQNPFVNMAYTFMEPLPVGLIITLISAAILRRKAPVEPTE